MFPCYSTELKVCILKVIFLQAGTIQSEAEESFQTTADWFSSARKNLNYLITWNFRDTLISRISRFDRKMFAKSRNLLNKVSRKLVIFLSPFWLHAVSYTQPYWKSWPVFSNSIIHMSPPLCFFSHLSIHTLAFFVRYHSQTLMATRLLPEHLQKLLNHMVCTIMISLISHDKSIHLD